MPTQPQPPPLPEPAGSFLFSDDVIRELTDQEQRHGIYTGERCPPDLKRAIVKLVGDGWSQREIARTLKTAPETIRNVATECKAEVRDYQDQLPRRLQRCIFSGLDRLERNMDSVPLQSIGITLKALHDMETLASGRATARVEHVHRVDLFSDWSEFVSGLEGDQAPGELSAQKNGAEIHSGAGKLPVMDAELVESPAADAPGPETAAPADAPGPKTAESEAQSLGSPAFSPVEPSHLTTYPPVSPAADQAHSHNMDARETRTGPRPTPPGGGFEAGGGAHAAKDNGSQKFLANGE